ncbi:MAG: monovalent cation/H+ antiporter complex subunit F, partial [Silvibacterium sp.]
MNIWLLAGAGASACLIRCADMCLRGTPERRLVGLEMGSLIVTIAVVLFTIGFGRTPFMDLPLALALMSLGGELVFA